MIARMTSGVSGVLVGRGVLRNPWILAQASDILAGRAPRTVTMLDRGQFLLEYIDMLLNERVNERDGFRHAAPSHIAPAHVAVGRERWVINKLRALCGWYSKGLDGGSHLRVRVNSAATVGELRDLVHETFFASSLATTS